MGPDHLRRSASHVGHYFGGEVKYTKRYQLGQQLGHVCRHFLLMSATPHNGKEEDFQLFMALLDGDRFEGRFRDGVHYADSEDMMRRLTKEELLHFDGRPLFPERRAYTVKYDLSPEEAALYTRRHRICPQRDEPRSAVRRGGRQETQQCRIRASDPAAPPRLVPAAIYQSLKRRRERLGD